MGNQASCGGALLLQGLVVRWSLGKVVQPQSLFSAFDDWCGEKGGRTQGEQSPLG